MKDAVSKVPFSEVMLLTTGGSNPEDSSDLDLKAITVSDPSLAATSPTKSNFPSASTSERNQVR